MIIDVYGTEKNETRILACGCKLRFEVKPITLDEVEYFKTKLSIIDKDKSADGWIVTNVDKIDADAKNFAIQNSIEVYYASLSNN